MEKLIGLLLIFIGVIILVTGSITLKQKTDSNKERIDVGLFLIRRFYG